MGETARFQETLRRLAMIDEGFIENQAGLTPCQAGISALDPKTVALLQVGASVAMGSSSTCLEWSTGLALTAGASEDEIADVLLAIAPGSRARPGCRRRPPCGDRARVRHRRSARRTGLRAT